MKNFYQRGISLIEVIIVISIIVILIAIVIPQFSKTKQLQVLKNAGEDIITSLNRAKSQTLASLDSSEYGVHFASNQIIIFKGKDFENRDPGDDETVNIISPAIISDVSLTGGAIDCYFKRLSAMPSNTGTITVSISSDPTLNKIITISATGSISIN